MTVQKGVENKMFNKKKNKVATNMRHLIAKMNPRSPISEQYRTLRTNIQFSGVDKDIKSILVTSSEPEAGKSSTAANLAVVYAQQGLKTLLVDGDMRKPTVHFTFRLDNLKGLSNAIVDSQTFEGLAQKSDIDHLYVITSGPVPPNPSELLASDKFKKGLEIATEQYEVIIVDSPPILTVTDAQILANQLDGVVIVARSGKTETDELKESVNLIEKVQGNILGTVLNDVDKTNKDYYYYYGT